MILADVSFYIPADEWPDDISRVSPHYRWDTNRFGKWNWTLQSFQNLNDHDVPCTMTTNLKEPGIVFAHRGAIPDDYRPHSEQLLVCLLAERPRHPHAQFHLLQDPSQAQQFSQTTHSWIDRQLLGNTSSYIRYWAQPGLVPRDTDRGNRFERIVFKGMPQQLADETKSDYFRTRLTDMGVEWVMQHDKSRWPDYSDVDAVLAIRSFDLPQHSRKPATKLYNAWIAGVPAILGPEPAFQYEGVAGENYLEARSSSEILEYVSLLKNDIEFRKELINNGARRAGRYSIEALVADWVQLLDKILFPLLKTWRSAGGLRRTVFHGARRISFSTRRLPRRMRPNFNPFI